jgi:hypothetical protein
MAVSISIGIASWKSDDDLAHSEYSTGVAKGQTGVPRAHILTQRRKDAKTQRATAAKDGLAIENERSFAAAQYDK